MDIALYFILTIIKQRRDVVLYVKNVHIEPEISQLIALRRPASQTHVFDGFYSFS